MLNHEKITKDILFWKKIGKDLLSINPQTLEECCVVDCHLNSLSAGFYKYSLEKIGLEFGRDFVVSKPSNEEEKDKTIGKTGLLRAQFNANCLDYLFGIYREAEIFNRVLMGSTISEGNKMMDEIWRGMKELYYSSINKTLKPKKINISLQKTDKINIARLHGHELIETNNYGFDISEKIDLCIFGHYHRLYVGKMNDMVFLISGHLKKIKNPELLTGQGIAVINIVNKEKFKIYLKRIPDEIIETGF